MEVILAKSAGFCFGVKRAVDTVYEQIGTGRHIVTFGPIIHNEEVVKDLEEKGVEVVETEEELKNLKDTTVVIRSHGVAKRIYDIIEKQGLECVDATCPFVLKIHKIVKEADAGDIVLQKSFTIDKKENHMTYMDKVYRFFPKTLHFQNN